MHPVEQYLQSLSEIRRTGGATAETSYYAPLEALLNEIGGHLRPRNTGNTTASSCSTKPPSPPPRTSPGSSPPMPARRARP